MLNFSKKAREFCYNPADFDLSTLKARQILLMPEYLFILQVSLKPAGVGSFRLHHKF